MPDDSRPQRRKLLRLLDFDYSSEGGYFITIVTHNRIPIFGKVVNNVLVISEAGKIARSEWFRTMHLRHLVQLFDEEFVVMPNHIHGIIWLMEEPSVVGVERRSTPTKIDYPKVVPGSIPAIVRAYKSAVTYAINKKQHSKGQPVWQRNYYEHVIRDEKDYESIVEYIYQNPVNWVKDEEFFFL